MANKNQSFMLGEIAYIRNGTTPDTSRPDYWDGDVRWVSPKDLADGNSKYVSTGSRNITQKGARTIAPDPLPANSILLSSRAPIGLLAIAQNELYTNQGFKNIIIKDPEHYSVEYIYYYLGLIKDGLINIGSGTTFKEISKSVLEKLRLDLPEYKIQDSVANLLKIIDDKISINSKINAELGQTARLIYDYWFTQFDFPDAQGKPYKSSGGAMVYNDQLKRTIPSGWNVVELKNISKIIMGQSPKGSSYNESGIGIPLLNGPADYEGDSLVGRVYTTEPTRRCERNDLVFCVRATIGKLTHAEKEFCLGRGVAAIRVNDSNMSELIYYALIQEIERFKVQAGGSIIVGITKDDLTDSKILLPDSHIVANFHNTTRHIFKIIRINKKQNLELAQLRDWLLPMLMTGQVKVV